jgi:hypothetical protein
MTSFYYLCQVETVFQEQSLEQYEADLGFQPVWVEVEQAIHANRLLLSSEPKKIPRWTVRNTFVLEQI